MVRFIEEAAEDPDVWRLSRFFIARAAIVPIVTALAKAARRGKHVTVIVELKARFDEALIWNGPATWNRTMFK